MEKKVVVKDKVKKEKSNPKKYIIEKDKNSESDLTIELTGDGTYEVEKLSVDGLPAAMPKPDNTPIRWFNNFSIKKDGKPIKEKFFVTIPSGGSSRLVILDSSGIPHYYEGEIKNNIIELNDGDPAGGWAP
jgi:hypothetical protein